MFESLLLREFIRGLDVTIGEKNFSCGFQTLSFRALLLLFLELFLSYFVLNSFSLLTFLVVFVLFYFRFLSHFIFDSLQF